MRKSLVIILAITFVFSACRIMPKWKSKKGYAFIPTINNNVCKTLQGNVVVYAIFVDTKYTNSWTRHDILSTIDSIQSAMRWIEKQAAKEDIDLNIHFDCHNNKGVIPLVNNFQKKTLGETAGLVSTGKSGYNASGIKNLDRWADKLAKTATVSLGPDTSKIIKTKVKPKARNELIMRLRDLHNCDNIALMYFINNYYSDEYSLALHSGEDWNIEYSIVSCKSPRIIAHEFLHLFGALDLNATPFDKKKKQRKKKEITQKLYSSDVMTYSPKKLNKLNVGALTKYCIGWKPQLNETDRTLLFGKNVKLQEY